MPCARTSPEHASHGRRGKVAPAWHGHVASLAFASQVDAPQLQQAISTKLGQAAFVTPGVGVDPTNEYRDAPLKELSGMQLVARQDLAERNLVKVSLDYYIQGFCLAALTMRPSAFYNAASRRLDAVRVAVWANVSQGVAAARSSSTRSCLSAKLGKPNIHTCVAATCKMRCNNMQ